MVASPAVHAVGRRQRSTSTSEGPRGAPPLAQLGIDQSDLSGVHPACIRRVSRLRQVPSCSLSPVPVRGHRV
jgi:hypothetical protein